jgi:hypothetical protein
LNGILVYFWGKPIAKTKPVIQCQNTSVLSSHHVP